MTIAYLSGLTNVPVMPRKLRVEYPGPIYQVMNRGDRRGSIFWVTLIARCSWRRWRRRVKSQTGRSMPIA
jgi:hypothetical protein